MNVIKLDVYYFVAAIKRLSKITSFLADSINVLLGYLK